MGKSTKWLGKLLGVKRAFKSPSKDKSSNRVESQTEHEKSAGDSRAQNNALLSGDGSKHAITMESTNESASLPVHATAIISHNDGNTTISDGIIGTENVAAIKIQTAFRAFLVTKGVMVDDFVQARRALRALKGLVRLQALARGHAVRKQAAISLRTVLSIVKFQAYARGYCVRVSKEGQGVQKQIWQKGQSVNKSSDSLDPLAANDNVMSDTDFERKRSKAEVSKFYQKLIPYATKQYTLFKDFDLQSEWIWLERWTAAEPWKAPSKMDAKLPNLSDEHRLESLLRTSLATYATPHVDGFSLLNDFLAVDSRSLSPTMLHIPLAKLTYRSPLSDSGSSNGFLNLDDSLQSVDLNGDDSLIGEHHSSLSGKSSAKRPGHPKTDRSESSLRVPSYMAATESAKAKARANSPKARESPDKLSPAIKRRFSLPGTNGKFQDPMTHPRRLSFPVRAR